MIERTARIADIRRGKSIDLLVDGEVIPAYDGETIAAALTAAGLRVFRHTLEGRAPRGVFCGIGVCFDCLVEVEGMGQVRSCMVGVRPGMRVSLRGHGGPGREAGSAAD
jgi:predicted molibdopterin-dependent oxidoreductase YjgC